MNLLSLISLKPKFQGRCKCNEGIAAFTAGESWFYSYLPFIKSYRKKNYNDLVWSAENMMSECLPQCSRDKTLNLTEPAFSFLLVRAENDTISDIL